MFKLEAGLNRQISVKTPFGERRLRSCDHGYRRRSKLGNSAKLSAVLNQPPPCPPDATNKLVAGLDRAEDTTINIQYRLLLIATVVVKLVLNKTSFRGTEL